MSENKTPDSQIKWQKQYDAEKMQTVAAKIPNAERAEMEHFATNHGLKLSQLLRAAVGYCIRNNIDLSVNDIFRIDNNTDI